jgi:PAS domain S-box-containing protein
VACAPEERDLLASLDAAVVATDSAGRVTLWNAAAERIFGRGAGDAIGRDFRELAAAIGVADAGAAALEVALAGGVYSGELVLRRPDGGERVAVMTVSAVRGAGGAVVGSVGVSNDVTEIRRGEQAIRRRHELYRLVLENVDDLVALVRPDGRILYASPSHTRLLGWTQEELIGFDAFSRVHPDDVGRVEEHVAEAVAGGDAALESVRFRRRDETLVELEARLTALQDEATGEPLVLSVARDVGRARQAEAAVQHSRGLFEAVLGAVPDPITVLSRSGELVYANRASLDLLGYASEVEVVGAASDEVLGRFELLAEDGGELPVERLPTRRVFEGADAAEETVRYRVRATGEERRSLVRSLPVRRGGSVDLVITVFHDVTEEERASRRLRFLADASTTLASSLDVDAALRALEPVVVPALAAGFRIELADGEPMGAGAEHGPQTVLPLESRGRSYGTLTLFGPTDPELAAELGRRVATALENAHLYRETGRTAALLDTLFATAPVGLAFLDRQQRFVRVNRALAEINGVPPEEHLGRTPFELAPGLDARIGERFRHVLATGEPLLDQDESGETAADPEALRHFRVSYYPIAGADGEVVGAGVVVIETTAQRRAEAERAELLKREHAARSEAEAAAQTLLRLQSLTEVALEHLSLSDLLNALLQRLVELLGADTAAILLLDEEAGAFVVRAAYGLGSELEESVAVPVGHGLAGRIASERRAVVVDDLSQVELVSPHLRRAGIESLVGAPLAAEGRVFGVFHVDSRRRGSFGPDDARLLELAADRIALAIEQSRLYEAERTAQARLGFLAEASALLSSSLDYERTLANLADLVVPRLADLCAIHVLRDDGSIGIVSIVHRDPARSALAFESARDHPIDPDAAAGVPAVIREGRARLLAEVTEEYVAQLAAERPGREESLRTLVGASALAAPLTARDRAYGSITFVCDVSGRRFSEKDLPFAEEIAARVGTAIDNARLYREAEERARAARILQSVGDGVLLVDGDRVVRYWNRAAEEITGLQAASVVDRPLAEAVPAWGGIEPLVQVGGASELVPLQLRGRELWLSVSGVALEEGTVYAFRDLTEERAIEELRTEFVSTVSHELRTPLAAIYGAAMTLRRADVQLDEIQRENLLDVVAGEADRLARTVNDILWASRLDSGMLSVAIESCDAVALAGAVVAAQRAHLPEGIELELDAESGLPPVAADADKVRQVLVNLLDNAVKYSPDGGRVAVRVFARGGHIRFVVSDEGLGIPYAEQRRIFDKFYRLDPDLTRGVGGTGLGLYICRALIRRMHGRIWVDSAPGAGSAFTVELPISAPDEDVAAHVRP